MKVVSKNAEQEEVVCFVRKPNAKDNHEAKLYSNALAAQIMTRKDENGKPAFITRNQVRKILRDSGRLSDEDEKNIQTLSKEIHELEDTLTKGGIKKSEGKKIALDLRAKRNALLLSLININELDEHTLEYEIENANFDCLVVQCSSTENGNRLFESVDDYREKADNEPYAYDVAEALKIMVYGTTEDMMRNNIENKFLVKYGYVNEKLQLVDKDGHLVDREGNRINKDGEIVDENDNVVNDRKTELGDFTDDEN